jgi:hypothetical protein
MKAPFPWFGGKRRVADVVWAAFGDVDNYVEPFAGSLAVLLERPTKHDGIATGAETVNDADAYLANFWRAVKANPEEVARYADWPVNETDLFARHLWLVKSGRDRLSCMDGDPDFYDAKVAGWWVWGQCTWIGSGWCSGTGPWTVDEGQLPHLGNAGQGVNRQLPHLGNAGRGAVNGSDMICGGSGAPRAEWDRSHWREGEEPLVYGYLRALQARLRRVRVCCGDWSRVVTDGALAYGATVGVFLDPPYDEECRTRGLYAVEGGSLSADVREWAVSHGADSRMRIALCGYDGEHKMPGDWLEHEWKSSGAYLGGGGGGVNRENRKRERIWFSPSCIMPHSVAQVGLFAEVPR